jgi:glycosyltransferase involved in cell wall biosynthesis
MDRSHRILGYVTPVRAYVSADRVYMQAASGRVADALALQYDKVLMCARVVSGSPPSSTDLPLEALNIELIAQPAWRTTLGSLPHIFGIALAYIRTCRRSDVLFVRGMCPYIGFLYLCALIFRRPICHWIVGDPVALLRTGRRNGRFMDMLALLYALQDRLASRVGRWLTNGAFICNGSELAEAYRSPRTTATASSTIREREFFSRADTCQGDAIRILFVGFIRPEKGIEHLLEAVCRLKPELSWKLHLVGANEFPEYRKRLDEIVAQRGIGDKVHWQGYMAYGKPVFDWMRASDLLVLPSLSEGTPHVLAEARANSLPCIATSVGGVPDVVTDGYDALLVPPKDSLAIAQAIERIVRDGELRRALIRHGYATAHAQTLDRFVALVQSELQPGWRNAALQLPQE